LTGYWGVYLVKKRQQLINMLGGKCVRCGSIDKLELDHIDPHLKVFEARLVICSSWTRLEIQEEIKKLQILCNPCHTVKTVSEKESFTHGSTYTWMKKKCKCTVCNEARRKWYDERNINRRKGEGKAAYTPRGELPPHGTSARYHRKCRCDKCKAANTEKARIRRITSE
jgi:hypothetical protein